MRDFSHGVKSNESSRSPRLVSHHLLVPAFETIRPFVSLVAEFDTVHANP